MFDEEKPEYIKGVNVDLRIILIGDVGVGKKSIIKRLKLINSTETKKINFNGYFPQKKKKITFKKSPKIQKEENSTKSKKDSTYKSIETTDEENEEEKIKQHREKKRINCMKFSKIYNLGFNTVELSYFPSAEEEPLPYDYELKEDDEFYDFEKEYRVSIRRLIKELEAIILKPVEDGKTQIEILFLLCYDLSNFLSFEKLLILFSQINKHFKVDEDYKMVLIGNKMDKRVTLTNEEKHNIDKFKSKFKLNYYETSTLMFFNFDVFFEKLIFDNFGELPIFKQFKDNFHDIIHTKKTFPRTKRPEFGGDDNPPANKYNNNPYSYPHNEKEFKKMFKDRDKYNQHIFINKQSILYPPIRINEKEFLMDNSKKKSFSTDKTEMVVSFDSSKREDVKAALELQSSKPGYTLGMKTYKPLGLFKDRERLRKIREQEKIEALGSNITLMDEKTALTEGNIQDNQRRYENNRKYNRDKILEEKKMVHDDIKERHDEINEQNMLSFNEKIMAVKEKQDKYSKLFEEREKLKDKRRNENYLKNNIKIYTKYQEPKCRFYDPIPSISTNKGFTFGKKYEIKDKEVYSPDYATFLDDFEKLVEKNKKKVIIKPTGPKIPSNKSIEVGDSSILMEKFKIFEERRLNHQKNIFNDFLEDRKYKKENVIQKKIELKSSQDKNLQEQIQKTYKNDPNYLIRDINYSQVESNSPSFSIRAKFEIGSIFQTDKYDKSLEFSTPKKQKQFENPNFSLIRPRYPAFSFGTSQRFNSISNEGRNLRTKGKLVKNIGKRYETEGNEMVKDYNRFGYDSLYYYGSQDSQSFLKMQTTMGTGKKLVEKDNGYPGPNQYLIRGFADDVKMRGDKINETRIKLKEKKILEDLEKKRMAKLREERFEERKKALKLSVKEIINGNDNLNNENKNESSSIENNSDKKEENGKEKNEVNINEESKLKIE